MLRQLFVAFVSLPILCLPLSSYSRSQYYDEYTSGQSYEYSSDGGYYQSYSGDYYSSSSKPRHARRAQYQQYQYYYDDDDYYYSNRRPSKRNYYRESNYYGGSYTSRLPSNIATNGEKVILIDPRVHAWGAYTPDGSLIKAGLVTAGARWCPDLHRPCRTRAGTFRIFSLGSRSCISHKFPLGRGGAKMPYCMFFNGGQGLHGSYEVVEGNVSHGCVRMHVDDAEWLRFNFAKVGTKVVVKPYN